MKRIYLLLMAFALGATCVSCDNGNAKPQQNEPATDTLITRTVLYRPGDYNSTNYRIPTIITAKDGSLVVATDKRKYNDSDLPEDIDILINRSTDGGRTWSEPYTLAEGQGVGQGFGDCALVRTHDEGGLLAAFVGGCGFWQGRSENPLRTYIARSFDNGQTWTDPKDITDELYGANCKNEVSRTWWSAFFASGNGLLTSKGRIMFVLAVRDTEEWAACNYVVYSDDNGETWQISGRASQRGDEAKVVELADGRILMSIRHEGERWYNISEDGGVTWQPETSAWPDLVATACNGDIIRYSTENKGGKNVLLHSLPCAEGRKNVTVYVSYDEGQTWPVSKCIVPYDGAYSSLCILSDRSIGFYVEESDGDTLGYSMVFYNFGLGWLEK
ncbi:MAG: exo-alpha-sialidase [Bacteroidales bacterium]|nr:exo-alpha-sialidase [Bacteroidales bacterium]